MKTRKELLAQLDKLAMEERAQLDRLSSEGTPEKLDLDPTEKEQYEKRAADIDKVEAELATVGRFEDRQKSAKEREERIRTTPITPAARTTSEEKVVSNFRNFLLTGETRGLQVGDNTKGGYLATKEFVAEIIKNETEMAPIRGMCTVRSTTKHTIQIPRRTAQFAAVWATELSTRSETDGLRYGLHEIPTHEIVAVVDVTNYMLEDPDFDIEREIQMEIAEQFSVAESAAFVVGTGNGQPWGVMNDTSITTVASGSSGDFDADDLIDLLYGLKGIYQANAAFGFTRATMRKVRKLKANSEYIWAPTDTYPNNITKGLAPTILGRPYVIFPEMADTGSADNLSVVCGDFRRGYIIVDHVSMQVLRDPYTQAGTGIVRFWARRRVGGQARLGEAIRRLREGS
jgi:HK97 family phage major capsid protein